MCSTMFKVGASGARQHGSNIVAVLIETDLCYSAVDRIHSRFFIVASNSELQKETNCSIREQASGLVRLYAVYVICNPKVFFGTGSCLYKKNETQSAV